MKDSILELDSRIRETIREWAREHEYTATMESSDRTDNMPYGPFGFEFLFDVKQPNDDFDPSEEEDHLNPRSEKVELILSLTERND